MQSVLKNARKSQIVTDPYPHLVLQGALQGRLYHQLATEFPDLETLLCGRRPQSNGQCFCNAAHVLGNPHISRRWQDFFEQHTSAAFYRELVSLFGDVIEQNHPALCNRIDKPLAEFKTSIRNIEPMADIALDCQFVYNAPSETPKCIRGPHLDRPVALYAGLLYFRLEGDLAVGGDLDLYHCVDGISAVGPNRSIPPETLEKVTTVAYEQNTLVLFPHSDHSVHGVSIREPSRLPRLHVNLLGEVATNLYS